MIVRLRDLAATLALATVTGAEIARLAGLPGPLVPLACIALLVYAVLQFPLVRGTALLVALSALAAAGLAWAVLPAPQASVLRALEGAAFLVALFCSLGLLRDAAETSPLIRSCGDLMVRQPPGRRYWVLTCGSHLISLVLNFGVLGLLGTMVMQGNAQDDDPRRAAIRGQRMLSAILRGFAVMTVWSPLAVSYAVIQTVVHGLPWWPFLPVQAVLTLLLLGLGWLMDRRAFPRPAGGAASTPAAEPGQWRPMILLAGLVAAVMAGAGAAGAWFGVRLVEGAMIVIPLAAVLWLAAQQDGAGPLTALARGGRRFAGRLTQTLPAFRTEVAMLGGAMFVGQVAAALIPADAVAGILGRLGIPPVLLTILLSWSVMALAYVGVSQILSVTVLGGALGNLAALGVEPMVLASGLMGAWALSACTTPVGAAVLTIARIGGVSQSTVARRWNGPFVAAGALLLALWLLLLAQIATL